MDLFDSSLASSLTEKVYVKEFLDSSELQVIETTTSESLIEVQESLQLLEKGTVLGSANIPRSLLVDESRPIAYVGYESEIRKLDYTLGWPPVITSVKTTDLENDWLIRSTLSYS